MINENPLLSKFPSADIAVAGVFSKLIQAGEQQFIFMEFESDAVIPPHSHNAQWGIVLDGEMELTINSRVLRLKKGDSYFIKKGEIHSAKIKAGYKDLTLFDQKDRYTPMK
ncbi:cupin domain-containing protein [Aureibacter tunicatorum]|uniref:Quercetin dioxygenase-like cupin family protein n=1 Tax=Aureibacter tunicatorum TaxID=866807 RepID=A0AAE3XQZ2_9BACT|nr:cupin domain-containing protein [Aureibacter tunicatorum]MDR6240389.1 quercetin dioxygenase-like cupin family protein [Aureibacter tunicatorum]BDD05731.1 hypothetical protein AUTU_32140 [Aureibacter tunicatorum]